MKNLCGGKSEGTGCNIGERKTFKVEMEEKFSKQI